MSAEMDQLVVDVSEMKTVVESAVAAFQGIAVQIADAAGDKAKSLALSADVDATAAALAAAIPAGTTEPAPVVNPVEPV